MRHKARGLQVGCDVRERLFLLQARDEFRHPCRELVVAGVFQQELVLHRGDRCIQRQVLHRLQVQVRPRDIRRFRAQACRDFLRSVGAAVHRLEVDEEAPLVQRHVLPVHADEGGQAGHVLIVQDPVGQFLLVALHGRERRGLFHDRNALDHARVLYREKALGNDYGQRARQHQGRAKYRQCQSLVAQHHIQRAAIAIDCRDRPAFDRGRPCRFGMFGVAFVQQACTHHRHQGQRDHGGQDDGDRQRHGEFMEQATDHVAHEQQRNQHRDQRYGQRDDGEPDFTRALQRGFHAAVAHFDVTGDVLDHHDGIVHHETRGDGERHEREIVEREAEQVHDRQRPHQRQRHRQAGDQCRRHVAQEHEDHAHHQHQRQAQFELHILDGCADGRGPVGQGGYGDARRQRLLQARQGVFDVVHHPDHVGARLALHVHDQGRRAVGPGRQFGVFGTDDHAGHVADAHGTVVLVRDDLIEQLVDARNLAVNAQRGRALRAIERAGGGIDVHVADGGAQRIKVDAERCQLGNVDPHPQRLAVATRKGHQPHARNLADLFSQAGIDVILHFRQWHRLGRNAQRHDRRVGGIDLGIDRRRGQVGRQQGIGLVDRGLHFLFGNVHGHGQAEAQRDDRCPAR